MNAAATRNSTLRLGVQVQHATHAGAEARASEARGAPERSAGLQLACRGMLGSCGARAATHPFGRRRRAALSSVRRQKRRLRLAGAASGRARACPGGRWPSELQPRCRRRRSGSGAWRAVCLAGRARARAAAPSSTRQHAAAQTRAQLPSEPQLNRGSGSCVCIWRCWRSRGCTPARRPPSRVTRLVCAARSSARRAASPPSAGAALAVRLHPASVSRCRRRLATSAPCGHIRKSGCRALRPRPTGCLHGAVSRLMLRAAATRARHLGQPAGPGAHKQPAAAALLHRAEAEAARDMGQPSEGCGCSAGAACRRAPSKQN